MSKLAYGARMLLARSGAQSQVDVAGLSTQIRQGGNGPPFFYLHSALGETIWLPYLEAWSKEFTVYAPAHPGFGGSAGYDQINTLEDMAVHYKSLLDLLGLDRVCIGGVSLGGYIAIEFACRWPERVKKLWLCSAPGLWRDDLPFPPLFERAQDVPYMRQLLFADPNGPFASLIIKERAKMTEAARQSAAGSLAMLKKLMGETPYDPKLPEILPRLASVPTLILWGDQDKLVPTGYADEWHKLIPHAKKHILKNCGHLAMFEQEAEFVKTVAGFCT